MIETIFSLCVVFLRWLADVLGTTYQAVNVWIFVVIWPLFMLALIVVVMMQRIQIRQLRAGLKDR